MTVTINRPIEVERQSDTDNLDHLFCRCDPDTALCGTDISNAPLVDDSVETNCVVCLYMDEFICSRCGE